MKLRFAVLLIVGIWQSFDAHPGGGHGGWGGGHGGGWGGGWGGGGWGRRWGGYYGGYPYYASSYYTTYQCYNAYTYSYYTSYYPCTTRRSTTEGKPQKSIIKIMRRLNNFFHKL
jgi:hypothetical protein